MRLTLPRGPCRAFYVNVRITVQLHVGWEKMFNWENQQEEARAPLFSYHPMETGVAAAVLDAEPCKQPCMEHRQ